MAKLSESEKLKRRAIRDARTIVQQSEKADANEAETRRRIERIFENVMGYTVVALRSSYLNHSFAIYLPLQREDKFGGIYTCPLC